MHWCLGSYFARGQTQKNALFVSVASAMHWNALTRIEARYQCIVNALPLRSAVHCWDPGTNSAFRMRGRCTVSRFQSVKAMHWQCIVSIVQRSIANSIQCIVIIEQCVHNQCIANAVQCTDNRLHNQCIAQKNWRQQCIVIIEQCVHNQCIGNAVQCTDNSLKTMH